MSKIASFTEQPKYPGFNGRDELISIISDVVILHNEFDGNNEPIKISLFDYLHKSNFQLSNKYIVEMIKPILSSKMPSELEFSLDDSCILTIDGGDFVKVDFNKVKMGSIKNANFLHNSQFGHNPRAPMWTRVTPLHDESSLENCTFDHVSFSNSVFNVIDKCMFKEGGFYNVDCKFIVNSNFENAAVNKVNADSVTGCNFTRGIITNLTVPNITDSEFKGLTINNIKVDNITSSRFEEVVFMGGEINKIDESQFDTCFFKDIDFRTTKFTSPQFSSDIVFSDVITGENPFSDDSRFEAVRKIQIGNNTTSEATKLKNFLLERGADESKIMLIATKPQLVVERPKGRFWGGKTKKYKRGRQIKKTKKNNKKQKTKKNKKQKAKSKRNLQ